MSICCHSFERTIQNASLQLWEETQLFLFEKITEMSSGCVSENYRLGDDNDDWSILSSIYSNLPHLNYIQGKYILKGL